MLFDLEKIPIDKLSSACNNCYQLEAGFSLRHKHKHEHHGSEDGHSTTQAHGSEYMDNTSASRTKSFVILVLVLVFVSSENALL